MFPSASDATCRESGPTWSKFRNAAGLVVAFMTLDSYGIDDLRRGRAAHPDRPAKTLGSDAVTSPDTGSGTGNAASPERSPTAHHHRRALRPPTGPRRPGAVAPREQVCLTPLGGAAISSRPSSTPTLGSTAAHDTRD